MTIGIFFVMNATAIAVMAYNQYTTGVVSVEEVTTTVDATSNVVSGLLLTDPGSDTAPQLASLTDANTDAASASQPSLDDIRSSSEEKDNF